MVRALLARLWPFSTADSEEERDAPEEDDEQVRTWDFIPEWQYTGWQADTGGLAVDDQEEAIADVQEQAEAIEEAGAVSGAEADGPGE